MKAFKSHSGGGGGALVRSARVSCILSFQLPQWEHSGERPGGANDPSLLQGWCPRAAPQRTGQEPEVWRGLRGQVRRSAERLGVMVSVLYFSFS